MNVMCSIGLKTDRIKKLKEKTNKIKPIVLYGLIVFVLLGKPLVINASVVFHEDFETSQVNEAYPWNGYNNDESYSDSYNRAVPITNFPEHNRAFLGNNVLYMCRGESYHYISAQTSPVKFEYDLLFHYSSQSPIGLGSIFNQSIIVNRQHPRGGILGIHMQKDYAYFMSDEDGIYRIEGSDYDRISEISPDTWYHVERIVDPKNQTEYIRLFNSDTLQETFFSYDILTPIDTIEGFSLGANYSPSYILIDNISIQSIPEPMTLTLLSFGMLFISKRLKK